MELLQDINHGYQEAFGAEDISSAPMRRAILRWLQLYYGGDALLQLPYTIVRKLTRAVFSEYESNLDLPARETMELALIGGESYLKPVPGQPMRWRAVSRGNILIFGRDLWGEPRDVGLVERPSWAATITPFWSGGPWAPTGRSPSPTGCSAPAQDPSWAEK